MASVAAARRYSVNRSTRRASNIGDGRPFAGAVTRPRTSPPSAAKPDPARRMSCSNGGCAAMVTS
ncbi:MAG TPA: hypothetical protein VGG05_25230 [Pseudonocardiaceae bacterium]